MRTTAILIGPAASCDLLERQLALLPLAPVILGRVHVGPDATPGAGTPVLGNLEQLESICATRRPGLALITLPAPMADLLAAIRTRLRKLAITDRFMPALVRREGYTLAHVDVIDRPRHAGVSNYGFFDRLWVGILDLMGVRWLIRRRKRVPAASEVSGK